MKLNVGCGSDEWGDIRLDVSKNHWMTPGKSSANIIADARYLPFQDKCFAETRVHEVLEHIHEWRNALHECCRVSRKLSITFPVNSYMPKQYVYWFLAIVTRPKRLLKFVNPVYLKYVSRLRQRTIEHRWQFDGNVLVSLLKERGFHNVKVETTGHYFVIDFFKHTRTIGELFKKANSWRITASEE